MSNTDFFAGLDVDPLADLLENTDTAQRARPTLPAGYAPKTFDEPCPKCRGTGRFTSYSGRQVGQCFTCKGAGKRTFKTSSADRAKARDQKTGKLIQKIEDFVVEHKDITDWFVRVIDQRTTPFQFAVSLREKLAQYGSLTDGQVLAARKCIAQDAIRDEQRAAARAQVVAAAPAVDTAGIDRLKTAFDSAVAYSAQKGLRLSPRITINGVTISPAKATSKNPGALYVKTRAGTYLGKIAGGKFQATRDCTPALEAQILAFVANPAEAAKVYGQTTGTCCICNATLISKWKNRGIGPKCAEKFGWAEKFDGE